MTTTEGQTSDFKFKASSVQTGLGRRGSWIIGRGSCPGAHMVAYLMVPGAFSQGLK